MSREATRIGCLDASFFESKQQQKKKAKKDYFTITDIFYLGTIFLKQTEKITGNHKVEGVISEDSRGGIVPGGLGHQYFRRRCR